jgi:hypothetical protein
LFRFCLSPIVLVVDSKTEAEREDEKEGKEASGGSFAGTTGKQPRTRTTTTRTIRGERWVKRQALRFAESRK